MTAKGHSMVTKHKSIKTFFTKKGRLIFKVLNVWPILILISILFFGIYVWDIENLDQTNKLSLTVLLGTAAIYCFQFMNMRQTSKSQDLVLKQQYNIAQKQHDFSVFMLRMNLRNNLVKSFTMALSSEDLSITNDVNMHLVNIGKICEDIKFAFPRTNDLDNAIKVFKSSCDEITRLATDKQLMIECSLNSRGKTLYMTYKECLRVVLENGKYTPSIIDKEKKKSLKISHKEETIILGTMCKYIGTSNNKEELDQYMYLLFNRAMSAGNVKLNNLLGIIDNYIKL